MITAENAREFQQRAVQSRLARKIAPLASQPLPQPPVILAPLSPDAELTRVRLEKLGAMMDKTSDARELDNLTRAYDRLFKAWMVLSGTPGSGQRKPPPMARARAMPTAGPVVEMLPEPAAAPVPAAPAPRVNDPNEPNG